MQLKLHLFPYLSIETCVVGAQKNRLIETVHLSIHNICWLSNKKNNFPVRTLIWRPIQGPSKSISDSFQGLKVNE